jgi:hypothetical protein
MYYVETRAYNSGYTNHRVICRVVIGSSLTENLTDLDTDADADAGMMTIAQS